MQTNHTAPITHHHICTHHQTLVESDVVDPVHHHQAPLHQEAPHLDHVDHHPHRHRWVLLVVRAACVDGERRKGVDGVRGGGCRGWGRQGAVLWVVCTIKQQLHT